MGVFKGRKAGRGDQAKAPTGLDWVLTENERILEERLRDAVAGGKFHLRYQPIVSLTDGGVVGVEALLRWESQAGRVAPATFIPVLEATGLVSDIGPWVLTRACRDASPWTDVNPDLLVTVNVSPQQLEEGFADTVLGAVSVTGFNPEQLCLDLIRPTFIADPPTAWSELRRLKTAGVHLFIDDFGSLGSSIADLRRFAIDAVKLDASFVSGLGTNPDDDGVVVAMISLARALGMQTIAEGVETAGQFERLKELGCDFAQGFHIMEPATAEAVTEFVTETRSRQTV